MFGFLIVLVAGVFFCFQNLIVRVLFNEYSIFGLFQTGGFVEATLPNSFLLMFMRMVLGVPLMALLSPILYPPTFREIRQLAQADHRQELKLALLGGLLMFLYLALLYVSIGQIAAGIALTLFFTFPVFTALFSWYWFGNRPTAFLWGIMALILLGSGLTLPSPADAPVTSWLGVVFGFASGIAYAFYTIVAQKSFETFHPVPFTWISFAVTLILSTLSLLIWQGQLSGLLWTSLWIGGLLSAIATFAGHVMNNLGIRLIGATTASMLGAANPALTAVLAWLALQEQLSWVQGLGVLLVTLSVAIMSRAQATA